VRKGVRLMSFLRRLRDAWGTMFILARLCRDEGQDLIEYALIVLFVVLIVALALPPVGQALVDLYYGRLPSALRPP